MAKFINNTLEIFGSEEQVTKVTQFLHGVPDEKGFEMFIDFNNIIKLPEDLKVEQSDNAELAQHILYGAGLEDIPIEEAQEVFENWDDKEQKRAVELAIIYQRNNRRYRHSTAHSWMRENLRIKRKAFQPIIHA